VKPYSLTGKWEGKFYVKEWPDLPFLSKNSRQRIKPKIYFINAEEHFAEIYFCQGLSACERNDNAIKPKPAFKFIFLKQPPLQKIIYYKTSSYL